MRSLITPMLLISLGIHGAFLFMPTSEEEKSTETSTEIAQAAEVENKVFPTPEAKPKSELEGSQDSKLPQPKEEKKAPLPSPKPLAVANTQASVASRTQRQSKATRTRTANTRATPQPQPRKTRSSKTDSTSNSQSSRQSQRNSNGNTSSSPNNSASTATQSNSQSVSTASRKKKNVPSNPTPTAISATPATPATQRRVENIPTFTQGNSASTADLPTPTSTPVISSLAPSNSNASSSHPVATVPTIIARTQNQDERVKNRLEFLKTFPRYPEAQWGLPEALQGEEVDNFFYRLRTGDGIEAVAKKFMEELLPQNKFTGELNTDEENWQVYTVSNGKNTQYLHLISQEGNTGIFLASEEFSKQDFLE